MNTKKSWNNALPHPQSLLLPYCGSILKAFPKKFTEPTLQYHYTMLFVKYYYTIVCKKHKNKNITIAGVLDKLVLDKRGFSVLPTFHEEGVSTVIVAGRAVLERMLCHKCVI